MDEIVAYLQSNVGLGRTDEERAAMVEQALLHGLDMARQTFAMHCEVAQRFASWLGLSEGTQAALAHVFERWDGHGFPGVTQGEAIPLPMRILHIARDVSVFLTATGPTEARLVIARRSGTAYDPRLAELAVGNLERILSELDDTRIWQQALEIEPAPAIWIAGERLDSAFSAIAAFTDLKSPWLREHSTGVAELAEATAWRLGLPAAEVTLVRRAALAHDLGRVGVSNAIWEKPGGLGFGEWERVRLHPHYSERAFAQSPALAPVGRVAGAHHERLDGSGYQRGARAPALDRAARILAAADCYAAMREARPHRPGLDADAAEAELLAEADGGRLDHEVVHAVLGAAGHRVRRRSETLPGGLTGRELEVLAILARGASNQEIAETLAISAKTAGHHVQRIYRKAACAAGRPPPSGPFSTTSCTPPERTAA